MSHPEPYPPSEPDRDPATRWPPRAAAPGCRVGRVEAVTTRVEGRGSSTSSETVLAFRIVDSQTGVPSEVELRGRSIAGTVHQGDWVEVAGEPTRSGRLEPLRVANLTTHAEVSVVGSSRSPAARVLAVVIVLVFLVVLVVLVVNAVQLFTQPGF
jgi:hypothetical protein